MEILFVLALLIFPSATKDASFDSIIVNSKSLPAIQNGINGMVGNRTILIGVSIQINEVAALAVTSLVCPVQYMILYVLCTRHGIWH